MTNMAKIKQRRRELCGQSRPVDVKDFSDDLAALAQMGIQKKPITPHSILIKRMENRLEAMNRNDALHPFLEAILILFKEKYEKV